MLSQGIIENVIVGGQSLGTLFAVHVAMDLEASIAGPRAVFMLDSRALAPTPQWMQGGTAMQRRADEKLGANQRRSEAKRNGWRPALVVTHFQEAPAWRLDAPCLHFMCPLLPEESRILMHDEEMLARQYVYLTSGDVHHLPESSHATQSASHNWDIARRLRGASRGAAR